MRSSINVVLNARVTSPGQRLRSSSHFSRIAKILCASTTLPCSSTAPIRSASPSVTSPATQCSSTTRLCVSRMCGRIGSGLIPGNAGLISARISTCGTPARAKMPAITPRPAPYMQSIRKRYPDVRIAGKSTKASIAAMYGGLKSTSSMVAGAASPSGLSRYFSIAAMIDGLPDPP